MPEEDIPEAVADLIAETFVELEPEELANGDVGEENGEEGEEIPADNEDRVAAAEEQVNSLKASLVKAKQRLMDLGSDAEAVVQQQEQEIGVLTSTWDGAKGELPLRVREVRETYKASLKKLKNDQKARQKSIKAEIKALEKQIPQAERDLKLLSNRGKLELMLADEESIGTLKERWIAAEVARQLDYPIFMAVSERGGKNNSGDYEYMLDEDGSLVEFPDGHPQEGQLVVNQDLVNYDLRAEDLADAAKIVDDKLCVAEAFVRFAQEQKLSFWGGK